MKIKRALEEVAAEAQKDGYGFEYMRNIRDGYFLSLFVVVLPGWAGWMGSGRFSVRPVKVSGGGQIVYI